MAITRFGHLDDFTQKNNKVGIGTSTPQEKMEVIGGTRSTDLRVAGIATLTSAGGFVEKHIEYVEDQVIIDAGDSGTLSGEIVVGSGKTMAVGTAATTSQGTVDALKVYDMFKPPSGGTNQRPPAKTGALFYNFDFKTIEFFDGNSWRQVDNVTRRGRGFYVGGFEPGVGHTEITYFDTSTRGNAQYFGDLSFGHYSTNGGFSSNTRGVAGGSGPATNQIEYITMSSTGNGIDFGDMTLGRGYNAGSSSSTRGLFAGGYAPSPTSADVNIIDYVEIATIGNALDFGDLSVIRNSIGACSSPVRTVYIGGGSPSPYTKSKIIDFVITASKGNAVDFGGVFGTGIDSTTSHSNHTRAITAAGKSDGAYATELASGGNSFYFADLVEPNREECFNTGNLVRGVITGGYPAYNMRMEEVMFASGGSSTDFGERYVKGTSGSSFSDSHGGLGGF